MTAKKAPLPQTYIIRCWAEAPIAEDAPLRWRYILKHVRSRQEKAFSNLADLHAYLALCQEKRQHR